jgi:3-phenylpropionate/trans-cinnamate dioxygenase ferredoxin subunit
VAVESQTGTDRDGGYDAPMTSAQPLLFPPQLQAVGTTDAPFEVVAALADVPPGGMKRVTRGDLDVLIAHTEDGLAAIADRCPHMSAPFSVGKLDGCVLTCPLHRGSFDLRDGGVVTFPTTGGLDADGEYHPTWTPPGRDPKPALRPDEPKAMARALTRVRRLRYYPLRIRDGAVEIAFPV